MTSEIFIFTVSVLLTWIMAIQCHRRVLNYRCALSIGASFRVKVQL